MEAEERKMTSEDVSSSNDDTSESDTELMVTSRARRATAGNRYSTLVAQEEVEEDAEDEVAMLFAEGEGEDDDFNSDDGDDEADMSSSDDDDQGPNVATDDLEGEKEIQKEAKVERARKRKADLALTTTSSLRKKPKFDPTALRRAPAPKPSKRKERVSWLPGSGTTPGRTSLRKQTILHRAETHAKMKENEEQRLKMKARREKRVQEREAAAPKEMTQADRLAEAERVERRNAKSLNRWEAMEKKRAEEQAAKLAALKERKLEGAVITSYSSPAKYYGLKETKEIEIEPPHEPKKRGRKPKALLEQLAAAKLASSQAAASTIPQQLQTSSTVTNEPSAGSASMPIISVNSGSRQEPAGPDNLEKASPTTTTSEQPSPIENASRDQQTPESTNKDTSFLTGIHEYASMKSDSKTKEEHQELSTPISKTSKDNPEPDTPQPTQPEVAPSHDKTSDNQQTLKTGDVPAASESLSVQVETPEMKQDSTVTTTTTTTTTTPPPPPPPPTQPDTKPVQPASASADVVMSDADETKKEALKDTQQQEQETATTPSTPIEGALTPSQPMTAPSEPDNTSPAPAPGPPPIEVTSTRNLIILDKFDNLPDPSRQNFALFYNNRKTAKPVKHTQELCPMTGLLARYRDPATGMGYANAAAYKKLQEIKNHQFVWSSMLGCYVGRSGVVARGVPEGFLGK